MKDKLRRSLLITGALFIIGVLFFIVGANGEKNAITFSRPWGASSWSTSAGMIEAFIYFPMIIGVYFFVLSSITFAISFYSWHKKSTGN